MKKCTKCQEEKPKAEFYPRAQKDGLMNNCKACILAYNRQSHLEDPRRHMFVRARVRAKKAALPFTLSLEDIVIPDTCPVLGLPIRIEGREQSAHSPSLDRIRGELGYTKENTRVISWRANKLKSDATLEELEAVLAYYRAALAA